MRVLITIIVACILLSTQLVAAMASARAASAEHDLVIATIMQMDDTDCCETEKMDHSKSRCASDCSIAMFGLGTAMSGQHKPELERQTGKLLRAIVLALNAPPPITIAP
ncbi:hypothetical protein [Maritalea porphyrae]|uniref:hypothetical protein n=1 Tax=Maritalea porphyrae TaxID=880732 RepID=UPI0022AF39F5|nr:hypothetical protein [Maritalea porphyrae]